MPRPKTVNVPWSQLFNQWLRDAKHDSASLAKDLGVSVRTVDRWRSGETVPDASIRPKLQKRGAPPLDRAKKGPAASKRIEAMLTEVLERLERIEERLGPPTS